MMLFAFIEHETLSSLFTYSAMIGGIIMLLQLAALLMGADDGGIGDYSDGFEGDVSSDASGFWLIEMISFRTLSTAATFFGLVGMTLLSSGQPPFVALALASSAGCAAMYAIYWVFKQMYRLETSGNEDINNAVGIIGKIYVPIDPGSKGKIQLKLQGRTVEYQAVSDYGGRLATGVNVMITEIISSDTVKVALRE